MTVNEALRQFPKIEADLLLAHILKKPKEFLYIHPGHRLTAAQRRRFERMAKLRQAGWPIAYLIGYKDFFGLRFKVDRRVLIPRPETEHLVELALAEIKKRGGKPTRILDMGTGSGCIIVSLAAHLTTKQRRRISFYGVDISRSALAVARSNAKRHKVKIKFSQSNLFSKVNGKFDIIIANLPYIPPSDYKKLKSTLRFEPKLALSETAKNWKLYERFFQQLPKHLETRSTVLLEIDPKSRPYITKFAKTYLPNSRITFSKDFRKFIRYAVIKN